MTEPEPYPRQHPELALRGKIRPVTRINRKVLYIGAGAALLGFLTALSAGLAPPRAGEETPAQEAFSLSPARPTEALSQLPATYDKAPLPASVPRLGAPMAGDLGGTIIAEERRLGLEPAWDVAPSADFRPSAEEESARAFRLAEAKLADEALKAGVFFQLQSRPGEREDRPDTGSSFGPAAELLALAGQQAMTAIPHETASDTPQDRKSAFAATARTGDTRNPATVKQPPSPYMVMAGTIIPASLITGLNSDLPGTVIAQVTQPVYDTVSGAHLLVPQGARLIGRYQSDIAFGQDRALIVWDRILFPNGASLRISEPGTDATGAAGLADRTDNHWDRVFASAGLATLLGIGSELGDDDEADGIERAVRRGFGDSVSRSGDRVVERGLSIQPTIRVRPGWPASVLVTRDLVLEPYAGAREN